MFHSADDMRARRARRVEGFMGAERRLDWPDERRIALVAESLEAGVNVSALARSHGIDPQQLFGWRRRFRVEAEALIAARRRDPGSIAFAPVYVNAPAPGLPASPPAAAPCVGSIEIVIGTATVRIRGRADAATLALVLKALNEVSLPASGRTA